MMSGSGSSSGSWRSKLPLSTLIVGIVGLMVIVVLAVLLITKGTPGSSAEAAGSTQTTTASAGTSAAPTQTTTAVGQTGATAEKSFASPEEAIKYFVNSVASNDYPSAEQAFAVTTFAQKFDFTGYANYMKALLPLTMPAPSGNPMLVSINEATMLGDLSRETKAFAYSFFETQGMDGSPIVLSSADQAAQFATAVDPAGLKSLTITAIETPSPDLYNSAKNQQNFKTLAGFYGADNMAERVVTYSLGGHTFQGGFALLQYGSDWKIFRLNSNLAGQPATGAVTKNNG